MFALPIHNPVLAMAGTLSKDMRDKEAKFCIPVHRFIDIMSTIFSANRNRAGEYVYNHAGIEPRTGAPNKYVLFADVKHRMTTLNNYVPTKDSPNVLKAEIVNQEFYVEVSATITGAIGRFVPPGQHRDILVDLLVEPDGPYQFIAFSLRDRRGWTWETNAIRREGVAPYIVIRVTNEAALQDLMNSMFDLDPDYVIEGPMDFEMD